MQFQRLGLTVTAFQMIGVVHYRCRRYPPFSWIVRGWYEEQQVVMTSQEFRKTFGERKAAA